jgi:hypothetical protein
MKNNDELSLNSELEEQYVSKTQDVIEIICADDKLLAELFEDFYKAEAYGSSNRNQTVEAIFQRRIELLEEFLEEHGKYRI